MTQSIYDSLKIGQKFPLHPEYKEGLKKAEYWEESTEGDEDYRDLVIIRQPCEESADYELRKTQTPLRQYINDIILKYNSAVYSKPVERPDITQEFSSDVDGLGTTLDAFGAKLLYDAQIKGKSYCLLDDDKLSNIELCNVLNWTEVSDVLTEVAVLFYDEDMRPFINYYNRESFARIDGRVMGGTFTVERIGELQSLPYPLMPVMKIQPFKTSQVAPLAISQAAIINLLSLIYQELVDKTFSKDVISGVKIPTDENGKPIQLTWGTKRITVFEEENVKVQTLGADKTQADSLRASIAEEEKSLYRAAGLTQANFTMDSSKVESGVSKLVGQESFYQKCKSLSRVMADWENLLFYLLYPEENIVVLYDTDYKEETSYAQDTQELRDVLSLPLSQETKNLAIAEFETKWFGNPST